MYAQGETDLALDHARDQQAQHGQPRQGGNPFRLLQPYGGDRRRILAPAKAGVHRGVWVLIGLEKIDIRTDLRGHRGGPHRPPLVRFSLGQRLDFAPEALARLGRGRVRLGWTSPTSTARAAGVGHKARASRVRTPGVWAATASARLLALIRCQGSFGIRQAGTPLGLSLLDGRRDGFGCLGWGGRIGLGLLLRQWARMHHEKAPVFLRPPPSAVLDLPRPDDAWSRPLAARFVLGPPRLCH